MANKLPRVLALSGHRRSGKDTAAAYLQKEYGYIPLSFAAPLKNTVSATYRVVRESLDDQNLKEKPLTHLPVIPTDKFTTAIHELLKSELSSGFWTPRALCILEGSIKRAVDPQHWTQHILKGIEDSLVYAPESKYVITDMRYKSEVGILLVKFPDAGVIRIDRPGNIITTQDPSERDMDDYPFVNRIQNDGSFQDLYESLDILLTRKG